MPIFVLAKKDVQPVCMRRPARCGIADLAGLDVIVVVPPPRLLGVLVAPLYVDQIVWRTLLK
jgi:hypothetical protein